MKSPEHSGSLFLARQPIVDIDQALRGYEILFRDVHGASPTAASDGATITAQVLSDGLVVNGLRAIADGVPAYINFPREFLVGGAAAMLTPPSGFIIEILESVEPSEAVLDACRALRKAGFQLALDDVVDAARVRAFAGAIDIVKVECGAQSRGELPGIFAIARRHGMQLLAEKVETEGQFTVARSFGFDLYQGYLFGRPALMERRAMRGVPAVHLRLLQAVSKPEIDLRELEEVVMSDATIAFKALTYANSARAGQRRQIRTVREALILFGQEELRRAAWIVAIAGLAQGGPAYLLNELVARAHFCESLAWEVRENPGEAFLAGLLSGMDAVLGISLDEAMERLPLSPDLAAAVLSGAGTVGQLITLARSYAEGRWGAAEQAAKSLGIPGPALPGLYTAAVERASGVLRENARAEAGSHEAQSA